MFLGGVAILVEFLPTVDCEFQPFVRDKDVLRHFREHTKHLDTEQIVRTVVVSFPIEVTHSFVDLFLADGCAPVLDLILDPFIVNLSGNDILFLLDVLCIEAV